MAAPSSAFGGPPPPRFAQGRIDAAGFGATRRDVLALALAAGGAALAPGPLLAAPRSLAADARAAGLIFGTEAADELIRDPAYRDLVFAQAAILTPGNALKFGALQPRQGQYDFGPADAQVALARDAGLLVHGHTLAWNDWQPDWLKALSHAEVRRVFDAHLETVVPHFAGKLHSWDVVNEPFWLGRDRPGTFRPGAWYDAMGPDYIFRAFRRTALLDPQARLVLNEAWTERADVVGLAVRRSLLKLIDRIQDKGLKLDAIGLQAHLFPQEPTDDAGFVDFLHEIAARRLDIYLTEFDIDDESFPDDDGRRDAAVAARAGAFLKAALAVPAVKMVIAWGLSDRYTWWRDPGVMEARGATRLPRPLPYDDALAPKPMRRAMAAAFAGRTG